MARRPYSGSTVSGFGPRKSPGGIGSTNHLGVDGVGGPNVAPENGVIESYGYAGGWGNLIKFRGKSGWLHYLAHNAPGGLLRPVGSWQAEGTPLGVQGMTGSATGIHVHWETRHPTTNVPHNPEDWLRSAGGSAATAAQGFIDKGKADTMATLGITSPQTGDRYRFFRPYGLPDRGVIINGTRCYLFPSQAELAHFLNFNRLGKPADIEKVVETVGGNVYPADKKRTDAWNREVFVLIAKIHGR